jgi:hypothetical protein
MQGDARYDVPADVVLACSWFLAPLLESTHDTTQLPFANDSAACSAWSRHTTTVKNDAATTPLRDHDGAKTRQRLAAGRSMASAPVAVGSVWSARPALLVAGHGGGGFAFDVEVDVVADADLDLDDPSAREGELGGVFPADRVAGVTADRQPLAGAGEGARLGPQRRVTSTPAPRQKARPRQPWRQFAREPCRSAGVDL